MQNHTVQVCLQTLAISGQSTVCIQTSQLSHVFVLDHAWQLEKHRVKFGGCLQRLSQMPHPVDVGIFPQARGRSDHTWCRVQFPARVGYVGCQMPHPIGVGTFPQVRGRSDRTWCRVQLPGSGRVGHSGREITVEGLRLCHPRRSPSHLQTLGYWQVRGALLVLLGGVVLKKVLLG